MGRYLAILKQNNRLSAITESSSEVSTGCCKPPLAPAPVSQNKPALATVIVGYAA
jgi:hypothetical protein